MIHPSILDNDFYKFTMQQGVFKLFPYAKARYSFINRGKHKFPEGFDKLLQKEINAMAGLKLTTQEKSFLEINCPYLEPVYLDFLQGYRYDPGEVVIKQEGNDLSVEIEGYWYRTILWEVPVMSLICELYYVATGAQRNTEEQIVATAREKIEKLGKLGVTVADFGTRRRYSYEVHEMVIKALKDHGKGTYIGSSNVHLAHKHNEKPIGTHAHEWFMYHAARYGFKMANKRGLENWVKVYRGDLGIALSDTYTTDVFLRQFDKMYSKLFDGVRHDSGDPLEFADKIIDHYKSLNIDPLSKTIIFSDGLNYEKVERIANHCRGRIKMSFGIGTNLTNDAGPKPMNIVLKMVETSLGVDDNQWEGVLKLSDDVVKHTGSDKLINLAKDVLKI